MPDAVTPANFSAIDILPWTGETPDDVLAAGAREYSIAEAKSIVQRFAEVSTSCDIDVFLSGFTQDCVVSFNEQADIVGHTALRTLMKPRFERFSAPGSQYSCRKVLRSLTANVFGIVWINHWIDCETGKTMRSKGVEFWTMQDGRIARWDASICAWPA